MKNHENAQERMGNGRKTGLFYRIDICGAIIEPRACIDKDAPEIRNMWEGLGFEEVDITQKPEEGSEPTTSS